MVNLLNFEWWDTIIPSQTKYIIVFTRSFSPETAQSVNQRPVLSVWYNFLAFVHVVDQKKKSHYFFPYNFREWACCLFVNGAQIGFFPFFRVFISFWAFDKKFCQFFKKYCRGMANQLWQTFRTWSFTILYIFKSS